MPFGWFAKKLHSGAGGDSAHLTSGVGSDRSMLARLAKLAESRTRTPPPERPPDVATGVECDDGVGTGRNRPPVVDFEPYEASDSLDRAPAVKAERAEHEPEPHSVPTERQRRQKKYDVVVMPSSSGSRRRAMPPGHRIVPNPNQNPYLDDASTAAVPALHRAMTQAHMDRQTAFRELHDRERRLSDADTSNPARRGSQTEASVLAQRKQVRVIAAAATTAGSGADEASWRRKRLAKSMSAASDEKEMEMEPVTVSLSASVSGRRPVPAAPDSAVMGADSARVLRRSMTQAQIDQKKTSRALYDRQRRLSDADTSNPAAGAQQPVPMAHQRNPAKPKVKVIGATTTASRSHSHAPGHGRKVSGGGSGVLRRAKSGRGPASSSTASAAVAPPVAAISMDDLSDISGLADVLRVQPPPSEPEVTPEPKPIAATAAAATAARMSMSRIPVPSAGLGHRPSKSWSARDGAELGPELEPEPEPEPESDAQSSLVSQSLSLSEEAGVVSGSVSVSGTDTSFSAGGRGNAGDRHSMSVAEAVAEAVGSLPVPAVTLVSAPETESGSGSFKSKPKPKPKPTLKPDDDSDVFNISTSEMSDMSDVLATWKADAGGVVDEVVADADIGGGGGDDVAAAMEDGVRRASATATPPRQRMRDLTASMRQSRSESGSGGGGGSEGGSSSTQLRTPIPPLPSTSTTTSSAAAEAVPVPITAPMRADSVNSVRVMAQVQVRLDAMQEEHKAEMVEMRRENSKLKALAEEQIASASNERRTIAEALVRERKRVAELERARQEDLRKFKSGIDVFRSRTKADAEAAKAETEKKEAAYAARVQVLTKELQARGNKVKELQAALDSAQKGRDAGESACADLMIQLTAVQSEVASGSKAAADPAAEVASAHAAEAREWEDGARRDQMRIAELEGDAAATATTIETLRATVARLESEVAAAAEAASLKSAEHDAAATAWAKEKGKAARERVLEKEAAARRVRDVEATLAAQRLEQRTEREEAGRAVANLGARVREVEAAGREASEAAAALAAEVAALRARDAERADDMEFRLIEADATVETKEAEVEAATAHADELLERMEVLVGELGSERGAAAERQAEIERLNAELAAVIAASQNRDRKHEAIVEGMVEAEQAAAAAAEAKLDAAREALSEAGEKQMETERRLRGSEEQRVALERNVGELRVRMDEQEKTHAESRATLRASAAQSKAETEAVTRELEAVRAAAAESDRSHAEMEASLNHRYDEAKTEWSTRFKSAVEAGEAATSAEAERRAAAEAEVARKRVAIDTLREESDRQLTKWAAEGEALRRRAGVAEARAESLSSQLAEAQRELADVRADFRWLRSRLDEKDGVSAAAPTGGGSGSAAPVTDHDDGDGDDDGDLVFDVGSANDEAKPTSPSPSPSPSLTSSTSRPPFRSPNADQNQKPATANAV